MAPPAALRRTPVYIICSPRPRVGKTLLARLLVEFLLLQHGDVLAFDINLNEPSLLDYHPRLTETANIDDTFGQMQLMDRIIANDGVPKVIDLGFHAFDNFFRVLGEIGFVKEAFGRGVEPIVLFMLDRDSISARAYAMLRAQFGRLATVPVNNDMVLLGELPDWLGPTKTFDMALLPDFLKGYITRTNFSFTAFVKDRRNSASELYDWTRDIYRQFREIGLRLLLRG